MNFKIFLLVLMLFVPICSFSAVSAQELTVVGDKFADIQKNVDLSKNGDVIKLQNKTYSAVDDNDQIKIAKKNNLVIQGPSTSSFATLNGKNLCRIFLVEEDATVTFKYINFINGNSSSGSGAAIMSHNKITVDRCYFSNNKGESGSAVFLRDGADHSIFQNSQFINNRGIYPASDNWIEGGAIDSHASYITIDNCLFKDNYAINVGGAVNFARDTMNHQIANCNFTNNKAANGGAIRLNEIGGISIKNCNFDGNTANNGASIYITDSKVTISNSKFNKEIATSNGGAIYNIFSDVGSNYLNITSSNFNNNIAKNGGAIYSNGNLNIFGTIFTGNKANANNGNGGSIYTSGKTNINANSKFNNNLAYNGGAIYSTNSLAISSSSFDKNNATRSGGSIYSVSSLNFASSIITNSKAVSNGGGICTLGNTIIKNSKINSNTASFGSGIFSNNTLNVTGSSFSKNKAGTSMILSIPDGIKYNNLTKIKAILYGNDNLINAIWHDSKGSAYINNKKQTKNRLLSGKIVSINNKFSAKTNSQGIALITYKGISLSNKTTKKYEFVSKFAGDSLYTTSTNKISVSAISKTIKTTYWNLKAYKTMRYVYKVNKNGWYQGSSYNNITKNWKWTKINKPNTAGTWYSLTLNKNNNWKYTLSKPFTLKSSANSLIFKKITKDTKISIVPHIKYKNQITTKIGSKKLLKTQEFFKESTTKIYFIKDPSVSKSFNKYLEGDSKVIKNNDYVRSLVSKIIGSYVGELTPKVKANLLFTWVRDKISYPPESRHYSCTGKSVLGTLSSREANCCDQATLLITMLRIAGIHSQYEHYFYCKFASGFKSGHVWALGYVNGKWYELDPVSKRNDFGIIRNVVERSDHHGPHVHLDI